VAIEASGAEMVTVAVRRVNLGPLERALLDSSMPRNIFYCLTQRVLHADEGSASCAVLGREVWTLRLGED